MAGVRGFSACKPLLEVGKPPSIPKSYIALDGFEGESNGHHGCGAEAGGASRVSFPTPGKLGNTGSPVATAGVLSAELSAAVPASSLPTRSRPHRTRPGKTRSIVSRIVSRTARAISSCKPTSMWTRRWLYTSGRIRLGSSRSKNVQNCPRASELGSVPLVNKSWSSRHGISKMHATFPYYAVLTHTVKGFGPQPRQGRGCGRYLANVFPLEPPSASS